MKLLHYLLGILSAFCLIFILLITSVEAVVYWTPGYFEKEYEKYQVLDHLSAMTMEDLLEVTDEVMDYLRGDREDLHITTTLDGQEREFFNEREIAHMEDVRDLFVQAIFLRKVCLGIIVLSVMLMILLKARISRVLPASLCIGTGLFFGLAAVLAAIISTDFTRYFVIFHHIFFDNDLWILDPRTDLLINIVPEGFFMDTAARIAGVFCGSVLAVFALSLFLLIRSRRKDKSLSGHPEVSASA